MFYDKLIAKVFSCPQCKGEMQEVHRTQEKGFLYIWLECTKPECAGQWLQKIPISKPEKSVNDCIAPGVLTR